VLAVGLDIECLSSVKKMIKAAGRGVWSRDLSCGTSHLYSAAMRANLSFFLCRDPEIRTG